MPSVYDYPAVSDAVVRAPMEQIKTEVDSIQALLACIGAQAGRVLEIACGTCPHGALLAARGFQVTGLDSSPKMLDGARRNASASGVDLELVEGNIVDFDLAGQTFDGAIFMAETFPLITAYEDIASHFRSVGRHVREGGLYVIDVDARRRGIGTKNEIWGEKTHRVGDDVVDVWHEDFPGDWVQGTSHLVMHCRIHMGDEIVETEDDWHIRMDHPAQLEVLLMTLPGWRLDGFYSWRDLNPDISDEDHYFMVAKRVGEADSLR